MSQGRTSFSAGGVLWLMGTLLGASFRRRFRRPGATGAKRGLSGTAEYIRYLGRPKILGRHQDKPLGIVAQVSFPEPARDLGFLPSRGEKGPFSAAFHEAERRKRPTGAASGRSRP